ncbi:MAG: DinB family protein [Acidobacteria bacterium]|nr:DinB family protein [Acidobacteriota bacterium]
MTANPYGADLGDLEALPALANTPLQIRAIVETWSDAQFERSYATGKWPARKILAHLAQTELALSTRARFALTTDNYQAQSFDQDQWMPLDEHVDAATALDTYTTLRRMNLAMWRGLTDAQMKRPFFHPDFGEVSVAWIATQMAGHDIHHLKQFEQIAAAGGRP